MPKEHLDWLWRASLLFGAVPALLIIAVRSKFMNESPLWAANQGDLTSAVRILRDSYGINAHEAPPERPAPPPKVSFRVLFAKPYRERTIVAGVMNVCISFEYTAIAFSCRPFSPNSLVLACSKPSPPRWDSMRCSPLLVGCWGCTGMEIPVATRRDRRVRTAVYRPDRPRAGGAAAGRAGCSAGDCDAGAVAVCRGLWSRRAVDDLSGAFIPNRDSRHRGWLQPRAFRYWQRAGAVCAAAAAGIARYANVLGRIAGRHYPDFLPARGTP